ncbi:MAG: hypothetical protein O9345_06280 [Burkholderiaceae bacterium]|nr:hypothetical protein [Burkholderiales bacterium]MCZ8104130.1 hypothetical protein [Burkholderiales bacterium]MCZ8337750.1 hypothetical protein [Burkholderiaceae bacterium]
MTRRWIIDLRQRERDAMAQRVAGGLQRVHVGRLRAEGRLRQEARAGALRRRRVERRAFVEARPPSIAARAGRGGLVAAAAGGQQSAAVTIVARVVIGPPCITGRLRCENVTPVANQRGAPAGGIGRATVRDARTTRGEGRAGTADEVP